MLKSLAFWIPGHVPSPNKLWRLHWSQRHREVKRLREKAFLLAGQALHGKRLAPVTGRAKITFEMRRQRLLDEGDNRENACKPIRDGVVDAILPKGDGPRSGYVFEVIQIRVPRGEEGVYVMIEELGLPVVPLASGTALDGTVDRSR